MNEVISYAALGIMLGSIYALLAVGYSLVFGVLNKLNLAHGDIFVAGAFACALLSSKVPPWIAVLGGITLSALLGVAVYVVIFDPMRHREEQLVPAIGSFAFGMIIATTEAYAGGGYSVQFPALFVVPNVHVAGVEISLIQVIVLVIAVATMLFFHWMIRHTPLGRSMRAIAENDRTASLLGVNVRAVALSVFLLSSAAAGLAAILHALRYGVVDPYSGFNIGLIGLIVMVLGGVGSVVGAMIGGIVLGLVQMLATGLLWSGAQQVVPWLVLVLTLVFCPNGLFGRRQTEVKV